MKTVAARAVGATSREKFLRALPAVSFWLILVALAWAPFPAGSNRPWAWSLLCLLIALSWTLWWAAAVREPSVTRNDLRGLFWPITCGAAALVWGLIQIVPWVPQTFDNPVWQIADTSLAAPARAYVSLEPWLTATELMKLLSYALAFLLARFFCARSERAEFLLTSLIVIGTVWCIYALLVAALGSTQFAILYNAPAMDKGVAAPFINHNNFATYAGMIGLCAGIKLVSRGTASVVGTAGPRVYLLTLMQYLFGRGAFWLVSVLLAVSALIATASRAGNAAFLIGFLTACLLAVAVNSNKLGKIQMVLLSAVLLTALVLLVSVNGTSLLMRVDGMESHGLALGARQQLWDAAARMIAAAPFRGMGLGTYPVAYPIYTDSTLPFIMDHAHNDYLELAAGWGLPAALLWWSSLLLLVWTCVRGVFQRKRNRIYPILAVAVAVQVGFHSFFDFSLQIPAIALTFAAILGVGVAQAFSTRSA